MPPAALTVPRVIDRKSTRLNSSHTEIYTLSLHDALPISLALAVNFAVPAGVALAACNTNTLDATSGANCAQGDRSEEHTSELQSHRDLHSFPTRRSSDLVGISGQLRSAGWRCLSSM